MYGSNPIKKQSVAEQIYEQLRAKIISGELRPGDKRPTEADGSQVMDELILHTFLNERSLAEIVEFRHLMESAVTRLACRKASGEDTQELCRIYQRMEAAEKHLEEFAKLDFLFHMTIAKISRNPYVIKTYTRGNIVYSRNLQKAFTKSLLKLVLRE